MIVVVKQSTLMASSYYKLQNLPSNTAMHLFYNISCSLLAMSYVCLMINLSSVDVVLHGQSTTSFCTAVPSIQNLSMRGSNKPATTLIIYALSSAVNIQHINRCNFLMKQTSL